jgi:hypothetical protein
MKGRNFRKNGASSTPKTKPPGVRIGIRRSRTRFTLPATSAGFLLKGIVNYTAGINERKALLDEYSYRAEEAGGKGIPGEINARNIVASEAAHGILFQKYFTHFTQMKVF